MTYARRLLTAIALTIVLAPAAHAALTTVTVVDDNGSAVVGASVSTGGTSATTDDKGRAQFDLQPGRYNFLVTSDEIVTRTRSADVGAGGTSLEAPVYKWYAWMAKAPAPGSIGVGPDFEGTWTDRLHFTSAVLRDSIGGVSFPAIKPDVNDLNRDFETSLDLYEAMMEAMFGLPRLDMGPCLRLNPSISVALGGNSVRLEQEGSGSNNRTTLSGDGLSWGAGLKLGFSFKPHGEHQWMEDLYFALGANYRAGSADVSRSPGGSEIVKYGALPNGSVVREDGDLDWHGYRAYTHIGYNFWNDRLFTYVGAQYRYQKLSLETKSTVDIGVLVNRHVEEKFKLSTWEGVAGVYVRPFRGALSPLFLGGELNVGGGLIGAQVKLNYQFNLLDW